MKFFWHFLGNQLIALQRKITVDAEHAKKLDIMPMNAKIGKITSLLKPWVARLCWV